MKHLPTYGMADGTSVYEKDDVDAVLAGLREAARKALGVLQDLSETEMACLRGRGDDAIEALEKALEATQADEVEPETVVADAVHTRLATMTPGAAVGVSRGTVGRLLPTLRRGHRRQLLPLPER